MLPESLSFARIVNESPNLGIWHETYILKPGQYEAIYTNCPAFGLGAAGGLVPANGTLSTSRGRVGSTVEGQNASGVEDSPAPTCPFR